MIKEQRKLSQLSKALFFQFIIIPCKVKFIDNTRFMASTLSNPVDILSEGIHKIKCKDRDYFLEYKSLNENLIKYQCSTCHKDYLNKMDEKLKSDLWIYSSVLITVLINLVLYLEKVFIHRKTWMKVKILMKHHWLKKKIIVT